MGVTIEGLNRSAALHNVRAVRIVDVGHTYCLYLQCIPDLVFCFFFFFFPSYILPLPLPLLLLHPRLPLFSRHYSGANLISHI